MRISDWSSDVCSSDLWRSLGLLAAYHVEFMHAVIFVLRSFCGRIALALLRDDVEQARHLGRVPDIFENREQVIEIMNVHRPEIIKAQFFEHGATRRQAGGEFQVRKSVRWGKRGAE